MRINTRSVRQYLICVGQKRNSWTLRDYKITHFISFYLCLLWSIPYGVFYSQYLNRVWILLETYWNVVFRLTVSGCRIRVVHSSGMWFESSTVQRLSAIEEYGNIIALVAPYYVATVIFSVSGVQSTCTSKSTPYFSTIILI